jgi:hypothetical protein
MLIKFASVAFRFPFAMRVFVRPIDGDAYKGRVGLKLSTLSALTFFILYF